MEEGDHRKCAVELLACPEHMDEQLRAIAEAADVQDEPLLPAPHCRCGCADADPDVAEGWCMWCDHVYVEYTRMAEDHHFAQHCPGAPQELKDRAAARLASAELEGEG